MDVGLLGFLKADGHRLRILEMLGRKESANPWQVAHRLRIHQRQADATIRALLEKGLLKEEGAMLSLTEEGARALENIKKAGM